MGLKKIKGNPRMHRVKVRVKASHGKKGHTAFRWKAKRKAKK